MRANAEELPALPRLLSAHGVSAFQVVHCRPDAERVGVASVQRDETYVMELSARIREACRAYNIAYDAKIETMLRMKIACYPLPVNGKCRAPWQGMLIRMSGDAMACIACAGPPLGNIARVSVGALFNGPEISAMRALLANGQRPAACERCALWKHRDQG